MAIKHLGESIDIHGGGADLIFPHHENEIAQSEAYTGKPFAKYWVHNGFITIDKEKMSKSLGNFFTIREILDIYDPEVVRLFILSSHYRSPIEFSHEQLRDAEASLDRYYSIVARMEEFISCPPEPQKKAVSAAGFGDFLSRFIERFEEAMDDDFNTALALGHTFELIRETNRFLDQKPWGDDALTAAGKARDILATVGRILNLFRRTPGQWGIDLLSAKKINLTGAEIEERIAERIAARQNREWERADTIRKELEDRGILLEDKRQGTTWKVKIS
jgi:cysteinyl-tRNA synthetase